MANLVPLEKLPDPEIADQPRETAGCVPAIKPVGPAGKVEMIPGFDVLMFRGEWPLLKTKG